MIVPNTDDGGFMGVCLEMDIWAYGATAKETAGELEELVSSQVEFATGRKEYHLLGFSAEQKWFDLWDEINGLKTNSKIKQYLSTNSSKYNGASTKEFQAA